MKKTFYSISLALFALLSTMVSAQYRHEFNMNSGTATTYGTGAGKIYLGPVGTSATIGTNASYFVFDQDIRLGTGAIGSNSGNLILKTGATTRLTISSSNGNVGIGVTPSTAKLHVSGDLKTDGHYYLNNEKKIILGTTNSSTIPHLNIGSGNATYFMNTIDFKGPLHFRRTTINNGNDGALLTLQNNGTILMGIWENYTNSTYDTQGHLLVVNGKILTEGVKVIADVPSADYVFQNDYRLRPLSEVEAFVKENKHLPGVPSAAEFAECGYNVGDMDNILLEKVEELTLYVIQMKAELDALKKEAKGIN